MYDYLSLRMLFTVQISDKQTEIDFQTNGNELLSVVKHRKNCGQSALVTSIGIFAYIISTDEDPGLGFRIDSFAINTIDILSTLDSASLIVKLKPRIFQRLPPFE